MAVSPASEIDGAEHTDGAVGGEALVDAAAGDGHVGRGVVDVLQRNVDGGSVVLAAAVDGASEEVVGGLLGEAQRRGDGDETRVGVTSSKPNSRRIQLRSGPIADGPALENIDLCVYWSKMGWWRTETRAAPSTDDKMAWGLTPPAHRFCG